MSILRDAVNGLNDGLFLLDNFAVFVKELASLDEFLAVVPGTTGVGGREGNLNARDDDTSEESSEGLVAEDQTDDER